MLLITSDMFKSLWYFVFPLVALARGGVPASSTFCYTAGFLISFGVEASGMPNRSSKLGLF
jgi:hypothetical protein